MCVSSAFQLIGSALQVLKYLKAESAGKKHEINQSDSPRRRHSRDRRECESDKQHREVSPARPIKNLSTHSKHNKQYQCSQDQRHEKLTLPSTNSSPIYVKRDSQHLCSQDQHHEELTAPSSETSPIQSKRNSQHACAQDQYYENVKVPPIEKSPLNSEHNSQNFCFQSLEEVKAPLVTKSPSHSTPCSQHQCIGDQYSEEVQLSISPIAKSLANSTYSSQHRDWKDSCSLFASSTQQQVSQLSDGKLTHQLISRDSNHQSTDYILTQGCTLQSINCNESNRKSPIAQHNTASDHCESQVTYKPDVSIENEPINKQCVNSLERSNSKSKKSEPNLEPVCNASSRPVSKRPSQKDFPVGDPHELSECAESKKPKCSVDRECGQTPRPECRESKRPRCAVDQECGQKEDSPRPVPKECCKKKFPVEEDTCGMSACRTPRCTVDRECESSDSEQSCGCGGDEG